LIVLIQSFKIKIMKNITILLALILINTSVFAQTNLVPNHNFQSANKKTKEKGQINMAAPWISPTLSQADLYLKSSKNPEISIPANAYGSEEPMSGDNYAGFMAYSYKAKLPRTYLQVKFTEPLKEGEEYCVTFHVSLSDLSKFACNYLGAYLSNDAVSANNSDVLQFEPQVVSRRFTVYETQFYWTPICAKYKAKGGEEYLTIGNFTSEEKLKINKVKRPQGFNTPQTNDAYYYLDNVSVVLAKEVEKCDCDFIPGVDDMETLNSTFKSDLTNQPNKVKIIDSDGSPSSVADAPKATTPSTQARQDVVLYFESKKIDLTAESTIKLDAIIVYLKANPKAKVSLAGYIDASEQTEDKLDGKRVGSVYKYILSKGVVKENVLKSMEGVNNAQKDASKNMKVEVKIVN
jgi:outer membrane protein OmpA-like peptidoglycan-associated protein